MAEGPDEIGDLSAELGSGSGSGSGSGGGGGGYPYSSAAVLSVGGPIASGRAGGIDWIVARNEVRDIDGTVNTVEAMTCGTVSCGVAWEPVCGNGPSGVRRCFATVCQASACAGAISSPTPIGQSGDLYRGVSNGRTFVDRDMTIRRPGLPNDIRRVRKCIGAPGYCLAIWDPVTTPGGTFANSCEAARCGY